MSMTLDRASFLSLDMAWSLDKINLVYREHILAKGGT